MNGNGFIRTKTRKDKGGFERNQNQTKENTISNWNSTAGGSDSAPNLSVRENGALSAFVGAFSDTTFTLYVVPETISPLQSDPRLCAPEKRATL